MRRAVLLLAVLALAGCGGGGESAETTAPTTTAPVTTSGDPGKDAIEAFIAAAKAGKVDAMWSGLSTNAKSALGPTLGEFKSGAGGELAEALAGLGAYEVIVSERIEPEFGVVAVDDGKTVYAVPLRLEGETWKVEAASPVKVRPIGPDPGAVEEVVAQIAAAVEGPGGAGNAVMYLDGHTELPKVAGTGSNSTLYANFDPKLPPGRHTVVVVGTDGREAGAAGWAFTVRAG